MPSVCKSNSISSNNSISNGERNDDRYDSSSNNLQGRPVSLKFYVQMVAFPTLNDLILHFQTLGTTFTASNAETHSKTTKSSVQAHKKYHTTLTKPFSITRKINFKIYSKQKHKDSKSIYNKYNNNTLGTMLLNKVISLEKTFNKNDELIEYSNNNINNSVHQKITNSYPSSSPSSSSSSSSSPAYSRYISIVSNYKNDPICDKIMSYLPEADIRYKDKSKLAFVRVFRKSKTNLTKLELIPIRKFQFNKHDTYLGKNNTAKRTSSNGSGGKISNNNNDSMESIKKNICYPRYKQNTKLFLVGDVDFFATIYMDYAEFQHEVIWNNNAIPYDSIGIVT